MPGPYTSDSQEPIRTGVTPPSLLVELPSRWRTFFSNLSAFLSGTVVPRLPPGQGRDYTFWKSLPPQKGVSTLALAESFFCHVIFVELIYLSSVVPWFPQQEVKLRDPLSHTHIAFYSVSDYLPPTAPESASAAELPGTPDPVYARQQIRSMPSDPDKLHQTIITPPKLKIDRDIPLPNVFAPALAPMQPLPMQSSRPTLILPPDLVAPPPDVTSVAAGRRPPALHADVVAPAPEPTVVDPRLQLPSLTREAVPPPVETGIVGNGVRSGSFPRDVVDPPVEASSAGGSQRSLPSLAQAAAPPVSASGSTGTAAIGLAGAPSLSGTATNRTDIIALSIHPAEVHGPIDVPNGNRRGVFAAGPEGRSDASGAPGGSPTGTTGNSGIAPNSAGLTVAPGGATPSGVVAASPPVSPGSAAPVDMRKNLAAAMRATSHPPLTPPPSHAAPPAPPIVARVFSGKRSFRLEVNMPNMNSNTGSWIIHFAERGSPRERAEIASPEVLRKVDPAYPPSLMHDGVEGTVVLWAIIGADGSVSEIRVLNSVDKTLDQNAIVALQQWKFSPGLKNGQPVDLEAVVQIPFRGKVVLLGR